MSENVLRDEKLVADYADVSVPDLGSISIRVFVLAPKSQKGNEKALPLPNDVQEGEEFSFEEAGSTPVSSYLEASRGRRCVVFLVNGQRQEFDDNGFIVQDLGFRYLRSRMVIMIDVDGLAPEAIGRLMQGSRQGFYKGAVREAITKCIIATLKNDPDLKSLELEAEEAVSELSAGDEKVKQTLDQLIEAHHDFGHSLAVGGGASLGNSDHGDELGFKKIEKQGVVTLQAPTVGHAANYPVLTSQPAASIIRLLPKQSREIAIKSIPSGHWDAVAQFNVDADTRVPELTVRAERLDNQGKLTLIFEEREGFDVDEYPIRANLKVNARFNGIAETRQVALTVLIKPDVPRPDPILLDDPTKFKVTSRQPIKIQRSDSDTHVRLRWDGKDRLIAGNKPKWKLSANLVGHSALGQPKMNFSDPVAGRFSLLISPRAEWQIGENLRFEVIATGPRGRKLVASFDAVVSDPPAQVGVENESKKPRLVDGEVRTGSMRRPPYELKTINRDRYNQDCWNAPQWTDDDAGAFVKPTDRAPLTLIINEDFGALRDFRHALTKRNTEQDVQRKVNKYTSHIAFHLYQMYQATVGKKDESVDTADALRSEEVRRVALTMIKLMDVGEK